MKIRNTLFGYMFENGKIIVNPDEAHILTKIFDMYLNGMSLQQIAQRLNQDQIEYQSGVIGWNKARVMRMIQERRYAGDEKHPPIISIQQHHELIALKTGRNLQNDTDRSATIFTVKTPVLCPICGSVMRRRHDPRCVCQHRWVCQSTLCRKMIPIPDEQFLAGITAVLNSVIADPEAIMIDDPSAGLDVEVMIIEHEIDRALGSAECDGKALRKTILDCTAMKYKNLHCLSYIGKRLKADFEKSSPLSSFSAELLDKTVSSINLSPNGLISLTLVNGQEIGME